MFFGGGTTCCGRRTPPPAPDASHSLPPSHPPPQKTKKPNNKPNNITTQQPNNTHNNHTLIHTAAREWFRVLKPGGLVVLTDSVQLGDRPGWDATLGAFGAFNEVRREGERSLCVVLRFCGVCGCMAEGRCSLPSNTQNHTPTNAHKPWTHTHTTTHKPHYKNFIASDLGGILEAAGFTCGAKTVASASKTLTAFKPASPLSAEVLNSDDE